MTFIAASRLASRLRRIQYRTALVMTRTFVRIVKVLSNQSISETSETGSYWLPLSSCTPGAVCIPCSWPVSEPQAHASFSPVFLRVRKMFWMTE